MIGLVMHTIGLQFLNKYWEPEFRCIIKNQVNKMNCHLEIVNCHFLLFIEKNSNDFSESTKEPQSLKRYTINCFRYFKVLRKFIIECDSCYEGWQYRFHQKSLSSHIFAIKFIFLTVAIPVIIIIFLFVVLK